MIPASRRAAICLKLFVPPQSGAPVVGRGHDSDALAFEEGTELLSRETVCPRGVTDLFETVKYVVKSDSNKSRDVCSNDPVGVELVDDAKHFWPQVLPAEAVELFGYVQEKVDFLVKKKAVPDEQVTMYRNIDLAAQKLTPVMDAINAYLEMAAKSFEGEDKVSFEEISSLLKVLGRQDEKKIVESIIEYQAEKARERKAERTPVVKLVEKDK